MMGRIGRNGFRLVALGAMIAVASVLLVARPQAEAAGRQALWMIVHNVCVQDELKNHNPAPCTAVNLDGGEEKGFAILKDIKGGTQFLLIPTAQISGIENPALLASGSPNYFEDAWEARQYINEVLHKAMPREDIALAVNSRSSRSQDQLHIHVDCVRADVRDSLRAHLNEIKDHWSQLDFALPGGNRYKSLWVSGENLGTSDPFKLLADGVPGTAKDMVDQTIAVIGATRQDGTPGFIVLDDQVNRLKADFAHSEELQDHECRVAKIADAHSN